MLQLRISSGIFGGLSLPPPYILEIISGLFSRLTHPTFQNKTLQLISLNFPFIFIILTLFYRIFYLDFNFNSNSDINT